MRKELCLLSFAAALIAAGTLAAPAQARDQAQPQASSRTTSLSAAEKKRRPVRRHRVSRPDGGRQIACTIYGCHPIPRHCQPEVEYDWWGNPTGFDAIVCR